ncbi:MAG: hypothetical protein AAGI71_01410 [Bacteroidota bacterium]
MAAAKKFGAFSGVFTPSILTILGVIMYLRLPTIVGQAGLWTTLGIVLLAHLISLTTGLSVSSIATDKKVKVGGTYYMLSRSLGLPIGGTLGLALFVGLSFSVSLYCIGFAESFLSYWDLPVSKNTIRLAGSLTLLTVTVVTLISTALALRMQFFIMAAILLSLLSVFFGQHEFTPSAPALAPLPDALPFIVLFGIFFPAVTGFEAGVSMSGDLQDPKRDIPRGTLWAIGVGLVAYIGLTFFFSYTVDAVALATNPRILVEMAWLGPLVVAGIWGATISSALGSILGAPRILQATALDRITPRFFGVGYGKGNEPRHALILTFLIAEAGILIGELDVIARIVSMFFITTYGFLNLSCAIESWASPDFRPDFKIPRWVSILGSGACFVVMILLDLVAMIGASVLLAGVYVYLKRKELTLESGDTWEGVWSSLIRAGLARLEQSRSHERNWRPNILLFSGGTQARPHLLEFGQRLVKKRGLLSNFDLEERPDARRLLSRLEPTPELAEEPDGGVFTRHVEVRDVYDAIGTIATYYGFAGVEPNTVMMGWARNTAEPQRFAYLLQTLIDQDLNLLLLDYKKERGFGARARIDVWWRGGDNNITLALALLRFLTTSDEWREATIRFLIINDGDTALSSTLQNRMESILDEYRVEGVVRILNNAVEQRPVRELIGLESAEADLTLLGVPYLIPEHGQSYVESVSRLADVLGSVLLIRAASSFNRLSLGFEHVTPVALPSADDLADDLPPVTLPDDETLQWALTRFQDSFETVATTFADGPLQQGFAAYVTLADEMQDAVTRTFDSAERALGEEQRLRARKGLQRTRSSFLFQAQQLCETFHDERLPAHRDLVRDGLSQLRTSLRDVQRQTPEEVAVPLDDATQAALRSAPLLTRLRVAFGRLAARLQGEPPTYDVPLRDVVTTTLQGPYQRELAETLHRFGFASHEAIGAVQQLIGTVDDSLARLDQALRDPDPLDDDPVRPLLVRERRRAEETLAEIRTTINDHGSATSRQLVAITRTALQAVIQASTPPVTPLPRADAEPARPATELIDAWSENQALLLNRAYLDLRLLAFKQRMATIVHRSETELVVQLQALTERFAELDEHLLAVATSEPQAPPARLAAFDAGLRVDGPRVVEQLSTDLHEAMANLPETVRTLSEEAVQRLGETPFEELSAVTVSLQRVVEYLVDMEFLTPLRAEVAEWPGQTGRARAVAQEVFRLATFQLYDTQGDGTGPPLDDPATEASLVAHGRARLADEQGRLNQLLADLQPFVRARLRVTFNQFSAYAVTRTEGPMQQYVRGHTGRVVRSQARDALARAGKAMSDQVVQLLYRRSEGVLYARQLQDALDVQTAAEVGLQVREAMAPRPEVLKALPFYYRQLFLGTPPLTDDLCVGWEDELGEVRRALTQHRRGFRGGLLIVGERLAGKTSLAQAIARTHFKPHAVFTVQPPPGGSTSPDVLLQRLQHATGLAEPPETLFDHLPASSVVIVDRLEQWWARTADGHAALKVLLEWIDRYGDRCLFLFTANLHAYRLMDRLYDLQGHFLSVVACAPAHAEQLKEIVLQRHQTTGLAFTLDGTPEASLSAWKRAQLFTAFFDYARGNVGVALHAWIAHIERATRTELTLRWPTPPDADVLRRLPPLQQALLVHFVLHGPLTRPRLGETTTLDPNALDDALRDLIRAGIVDKSDRELYSINVFLQPHVTHLFTQKGWL